MRHRLTSIKQGVTIRPDLNNNERWSRNRTLTKDAMNLTMTIKK